MTNRDMMDGEEPQAAERLHSDELLRNNEALRKEITRLRVENSDLLKRLEKLAGQSQADREFRRAALNLMEDAVHSRQLALAAHEERKLAEARLEETVARRTLELNQTVSELESFSYTVAHDMRAPLRTMRGFGEILTEQYANKLDAQARDYLARITSSAERMDRLIQDVLNYSKIVRSNFPLERADLGEVLRGVIESYPQFSDKNASITIEEPLPNVMAYSAGLAQCLANLLGNAVKFMPSGVKPEIRIWADRRGSSVRLYVKDNGIGIDPEYHQKIFGVFEQVSKAYDGTGIGLAIVKKAAERMGGKVGLESSLGRGSTFWIELGAAAQSG